MAGECDHPQFTDKANGNRVVVNHLGPGGGAQHRIGLSFPDNTGAPSDILADSNTPNWPSVDIDSDGDLHVVWQESTALKYRTCDHTADCTDADNWDTTATIADSGDCDGFEHPQIRIADDIDRIFVFFECDIDNTSGKKMRVELSEICDGGTWPSTPELLRTPGQATDDQSLELGRPRAAIDLSDDRVHVAFLESDAILQAATTRRPVVVPQAVLLLALTSGGHPYRTSPPANTRPGGRSTQCTHTCSTRTPIPAATASPTARSPRRISSSGRGFASTVTTGW